MTDILISRARDGEYFGDAELKSTVGSSVVIKTKRLFRAREIYIVFDRNSNSISAILSENLCEGFLKALEVDYRSLGLPKSRVEVLVTSSMPADVLPYFKKNPQLFSEYVAEYDSRKMPEINGFARRRIERGCGGMQ